MTLDEAIKHAEEVADEKESEAQDLEYSKLDWKYEANKCSECAKEHRQLAEWLKDYKRLLEQEPKTGHWIEKRTYMECPHCHDIWHYEENQTERFKCCPTCGEKMIESQERGV